MSITLLLFSIVFLCIVVLSTQWKQTSYQTDGFTTHPDYVETAQDKFNPVTNTLLLPSPSIPLTPQESAKVQAALGGVRATPGENGMYRLQSTVPYTTPDAMPNALEQAKKCESAPASCDAFDDPTFAAQCGVSFDAEGLNSEGKRFMGGLYVSPNDREVYVKRAQESSDPLSVAQPSIGKAKPGTFSLTKDNCRIIKEKIDCETKQTFGTPNCTQCYSSQHFSRVGPETGRAPTTLYLVGNGTLTVQSTHRGISGGGRLSDSQPITITLPADAEGAVIDFGVSGGTPSFLAGYLEGKTGRGPFRLDMNRMVQSDKITNARPRISGSIQVNGIRCVTMIPGNGKTALTISCLMPFSFLNPFDQDAIGCDNGPVITKETSATFLGSDPCYSKDNKPGQYKLECLQDRWISLGGTQKGTGYPSTPEKANALQKGPNGQALDIDTIIDQVAAKIRRGATGTDTAGRALSLADWNEASMWAFGLPIQSPCDGQGSDTGPLSKECLTYLYTNKGATTHVGPTYTLLPSQTASSKGQAPGDIPPNTFCQPGTAIDPSTAEGLAFGQRLGGVQAVKQVYDRIHRLANDNSKTNLERTEAVKQCYGTSLPPPSSNKVVGRTQVFAVGPDYRYSRDQAAGVCAKYNATVATTAQLQEAQKKGADWCFSAWVADSATGKWPITTSVMGGCGGRRGIIEWTPDQQRAGVTCYGPKPAIQDVKGDEIKPFSADRWDEPDDNEPTSYSIVRGGYLQTSAGQTSCFNGLSPEQAQETCNQLGAGCGGFSYSVDGSGSGCYKDNVEGGKVNDPKYIGYIKTPIPKVTTRARYIKLQYDRSECLNLAEIRVFSDPTGPNKVTPNTVVTKSSGHGSSDTFPVRNFVDGNLSNFVHTSCYDIPWILVDMGSVIPIAKVMVYNRTDCCQERARGMRMILLDDAKKEVYRSEPVRTVQGIYVWFPPNTQIFSG